MEIKDSWIQIEENQIFVREIKVHTDIDQPYLVFLHDALGSIRQWKQFPEILARKCNRNAIVYDRLGHGQSSAFKKSREKDYMHIEAKEVLPQLLKQLNIQKSILVGHSDGGTIALLYGAQFPAEAIISIAAHIFVEEITLNSIQKVDLECNILVQRLRKYHKEKSLPLYEAWRDTWLSKAFQDFNIEEEIRSITQPIFIIQAKDDEYGTNEQVERIISNTSSIIKKVYQPKRGGHHPHFTDIENISNLIAQFIREIN